MSSSRKLPPNDPHAEREAEKYANPIPSREYLLEVLAASAGPLTLSEIAERLELDHPDDLEALRRRLIAMERDGQLHSNRRGAYGRVDKMELIRGRVQGHRDGFGFLIPAEGGDDIFLASRQMRKVFDGDEVLVRVIGRDRRGRPEGKIVEVLTHNTREVVGRFHQESGIRFLRPDNPRIAHDILIPAEADGGAKPGQIAVATITKQPARDNLPVGKISEVLGDHLAPGMEIDVAIRNNGIPHEWPQAVLDQAAAIPATVAEEDKRERIDLRELPFVTIDGEDARDFDDAVYCERKRLGGWRLWVAIADVSHYVHPDTALDREAQERGNSVYFPNHVVPMLPEALSNGLCSLNPEVDRLVLVCEMTISRAGRISGYQFYEGLIHSHARLTYTRVGQIIAERGEDNGAVRQQFAHLLPQLDALHDLYRALRRQRESRGAIDFDTVETRIIFDAERKIDQIVPVVRNDAHKLIEECMLAANTCTAALLQKSKLPALYRVHSGPSAERLEKLRDFLGELGLNLPGGLDPDPRDYQQLLASVEHRPDAHLIQTMLLRSLAQAVYQPDNEGHFGLGYDAYTHFTSPIRRYPDLLVHRALRYLIRNDKSGRKTRRAPGAQPLQRASIYPYEYADLDRLGAQCSMTERRADDATRDVVSWLKCEFLQDKVGEVFGGVISAVTGFGCFVELKDLYIDGLVHITALPSDYYHFEPAHQRLVGDRTRKVYRLGDEVTVQVARVDLDERKIDLELVGEKTRDDGRRRKRRGAPVNTPAKGEKVAVSHEARELADDFYAEEQRRRNKGKKAKPAGGRNTGTTATKGKAKAKSKTGAKTAPGGERGGKKPGGGRRRRR